MAALRAWLSALHEDQRMAAYNLQLLQISLSSSIDPPHGLFEGISNILNILHSPLIMGEDD